MYEDSASEKITIIEGPTPLFELIPGGWVTGIIESSQPSSVAVTRLRTFNGDELISRCHRAWDKNNEINLEYRNVDGINTEIPIVAARCTESDDGQILFLWVRLPEDEFDLEFDENMLDDALNEDDPDDDEFEDDDFEDDEDYYSDSDY
ncbi:MAG: hypothetical protein JXA19_06670 [Anaerolineales bacterium]|nr:hypothetical protein [Anaerolineales bacterium]